MSKYKYSVQIISSKNPVKIYKQLIICPFKGYISWQHYKVVDSFDKILSLIKNSHFKALDLTALIDEEIDEILEIANPNLEYLTLNYCSFNNESIEKCKNLIIFCGNNLRSLTSLWNTKKNKTLERLSLFNCKYLKDISNIKNSKLTTLEISVNAYEINNSNNIEDYSVFKSMKQLENLTLFVKDNIDKVKDLKDLSKLTNIKYLSLPKNFFTFNQFAWLKSKLLEEKNISALYNIRKDISNERIYADIIGSDKPDHVYKDEADLEAYQNEFIKLIEQYKNVKQPF